MNLFVGTVAFSDYFGEYCKAVMTDHFCYMINEVTPNPRCSSSKQSSTFHSQGAEKESSEEEQPVIRICYRGYTPPDIPSCIEKMREEELISLMQNWKY